MGRLANTMSIGGVGAHLRVVDDLSLDDLGCDFKLGLGEHHASQVSGHAIEALRHVVACRSTARQMASNVKPCPEEGGQPARGSALDRSRRRGCHVVRQCSSTAELRAQRTRLGGHEAREHLVLVCELVVLIHLDRS